MLINFLLILMLVLRLWTAAVLFLTGRQNKLTNLFWLAASFVLFAIGASFAPTAGNPLGHLMVSLWLFIMLGILAAFATIQFVSETFYRNQKAATSWIWGVAAAMSAVALYGAWLSTSNTHQHPLAAALPALLCVIFGWQGWTGYQAWAGVAREKAVEDWVKGRYLLVVCYSIFQFVGCLSSTARIFLAGGNAATALGGLMAIITLLTNIGLVAFAYLAWAAPQGFYQWLNRNYRPVEMKEINEEELMRQMMS
jgi:hypothetical protein